MFLRFHRAHRFVGLLFLIVVVALVALAVVLLVRAVRPGKSHALQEPPWPRPGTPSQFDPVLGELRMRYARGEISREEYLRRAADLGYSPSAAGDPAGPGGPPTTPFTGVPPG